MAHAQAADSQQNEPHVDQKSFEEKVIQVARTTKVVKGGRILRFRALVVVGDRRGRFGIGIGKGREVQGAIKKAIDGAIKSMVQVSLTEAYSIQHPVVASHGASKVIMQPAVDGTGIIAGGAVRAICEVLGIRNILAKCIGSTNPVNVVYATLAALKAISTKRWVAEKRGFSLEELR